MHAVGPLVNKIFFDLFVGPEGSVLSEVFTDIAITAFFVVRRVGNVWENGFSLGFEGGGGGREEVLPGLILSV